VASVRKPFIGTWNILRFNWHFYASATGVCLLILALNASFNHPFACYAYLMVVAIGWVTAVSLGVSAYVYDFSGLYRLAWLNGLQRYSQAVVVNIHAGFEETSALIHTHVKPAELLVLDFYDPAKHTEVSIRRARNAYPAFPGTQAVKTDQLPAADSSADLVLLMLAAHEIRQEQERINFFREARRITRPTGQVVVVEHLRDTANFLAYTIGAFHFYSRRSWQRVFQAAGLYIVEEKKLTAFISVFILQKDDPAA
jgi:SAM-dependent methyltransferase